MTNALKVALIQTELLWENPNGNRLAIGKLIDTIAQQADIIVLPEMFTSAFTMNADKVAETMEGESTTWLKQLAAKKNTAITGSLVITENGKFYNRLVFVFPDGKLQFYDKRHTFTLAGEDSVYTAGIKKIIVEYKGWRICPLICYDLRFPVWARNTQDYDLLIYIANWPKPRIAAWNALLKARAIENMSYCIGVNRTGTDGLGYVYTGNSAVYDYLGEELLLLKNKPAVKIISLQKDEMIKTRAKLQFLNDRDKFTIVP